MTNSSPVSPTNLPGCFSTYLLGGAGGLVHRPALLALTIAHLAGGSVALPHRLILCVNVCGKNPDEGGVGGGGTDFMVQMVISFMTYGHI
jgi:hypothetical protein